MSNLDRLKEAGIIDREKTLSDEQRQAIESLTAEEVNQLISVNQKLDKGISTDDAVIELPGRNPPPITSSQS